MKEEREDFTQERLLSLLKVSRPEAFWARQRSEILARIETPTRSPVPIRWLAPAFAAALVITVLVLRRESSMPPTDIPPAQDWALLEKLDLLENWEAIESINGNGKAT